MNPNSAKTIGLNLYTIREAMAENPEDALKRIAAMGYNSVEAVTYSGSQLFYGYKPADFSRLLNDLGLFMPSSMYLLGLEEPEGNALKGTLLHGWQQAIDDALKVGVEYMVCAYLTPAERGDLDLYKRIAAMLNRAGEQCKEAGIQFLYHHHDFEFEPQGEKVPFFVLLENTDPQLVQMELDFYWAVKGGADPLSIIQNHPGRFPIWHIKDMNNPVEKDFAEVGTGIIDFKKAFEYRDISGMKYFFVEQDECKGSPFDSIAKSYEYVTQHLL